MLDLLTKPIPRPPTVARVALAAVLGVPTTVAVAWALAYFADGNLRSMGRGSGFSMDVALQLISTPLEMTPGAPGYSMDNGMLILAPPSGTEVYMEQVTRTRRWGTDIVEVWVPSSMGGPRDHRMLLWKERHSRLR